MNKTDDVLQQMDDALQTLGATQDGAEAHGTLVGLLCAAGHADKKTWLAYIAPSLDTTDLLQKEAMKPLEALFETTVSQLSSPLLDFQPLLPDDDITLDLRTQALGEWCQGFLMGLSLGGMVANLDELPGDSGEIIRDLVDIAKVGNFDLEGGDKDEESYSELVEYLRTGVLLINEDLNPIKAPPKGEASLH